MAVHELRVARKPAILLRLAVKLGAGIRRGEADLQGERVDLFRKLDGLADRLPRLAGQAEDEGAVDGDAELFAVRRELPRLLQPDAFLDVVEDALVAAFVADEEQPQPGVAHRFQGLVIHVRPRVAAPGQAEFAELPRDLAGARLHGGEGVVVEKKLLHLREKPLRLGHLAGHGRGRFRAILVPAHGLRPEAKGTLRRAAPARVVRDVGMLEVADGVVLDRQVARIHVHHARQRIEVRDDRALRVVRHLALAAKRQPVDLRERFPQRHVAAGEVELLAPHKIHRLAHRERFVREHRRVRAHEAHGRVGVLTLQRLGQLAVPA